MTIAASPDQFEQVARNPCIKGMTWKYPELADDVLRPRNIDEMVAVRLALMAERLPTTPAASLRGATHLRAPKA